MKFLHTALALLFLASFLNAQTLQTAPFNGNPVLKTVAAQQSIENAKLVERMTGKSPSFSVDKRESSTCPPDVEGNIVESGHVFELELDTFGLMQGNGEVSLTLENEGDLQYGSAEFADSFLLLTYTAAVGLDGANTEEVKFKLSQPGHDTIFSVFINVRRAGRVVVTSTQTVQPESITTFCLNNELDFDKPKVCAGSKDELDNYDGRDFVFHHLSSYDYPDTCLVYYSSSFPGIDTMSINICDEWGVCDVFKVPYVITGDTLSIGTQPFFDDFSAYDGVYPTHELWLDKSVYRNTTLAKDPPSVGFVTFDGLDFRGDPYDEIIQGVGDRLTSKAIDLSGFTPASNVSLRFFVAQKGYGWGPELLDELTVEFRNNQREWVKVATFSGSDDIPLDSVPPFIFNGIPVDDPQFFHEAFQFRFNANISPFGEYENDLWHLDYVMLSINTFSNNSDFEDMAFTMLPKPILKQYTSMPWKHFKANFNDETALSYAYGFYNHTDDTNDVEDSSVNYVETTLPKDFNLNFPIEGGVINVPSKQPFNGTGQIPESKFNGIINVFENDIPVNDFINIETKYTLTFSTGPSFFKNNDTVTINTPFSNYFAHDDGTAERQVFVESAVGTEQIVSKFHANVEDEMRYVQIMFPHINGDISSQLFNLVIYVDSLDDEPEFQRSLLKPIQPNIAYDTLQGFTTYPLDNFGGELLPLTIPANTDFYVGIQQVSIANASIPIGFDLQNDCDCGYYNFNNDEWSPLPSSYQGAMMIRPVFGDTTPTSEAQESAENGETITIFPNPSQGLLNFNIGNNNYQDNEITVFNSIGQLVLHRFLQPRFDISHLNNGIYFVVITNKNTGEASSHRIILAKP